jgi:hypothetical protein
MNNLLPILVAGLTLTSVAQADEWCKHRADRSASIDTTGASRIVIGTGAGDLKVRGESGRSKVEAKGEACASNEELLGKIQLETRRDGETVYLKTLMPEMKDGSWFGATYATMDLVIALPDSIPIELEDSSGDLELHKVKSAIVADSSGEMEIEDIQGDLEVTDSSGDIEIEQVTGNLKLSDSSGDITVEGVKGDVVIPIDSSGDIRIVQVGSVHIRNDTSGEIFVRNVNRDVRVDVDSSGDINVEDVGGNFTVGADSSGSVHHSKVVGTVQVAER